MADEIEQLLIAELGELGEVPPQPAHVALLEALSLRRLEGRQLRRLDREPCDLYETGKRR
ncbi:hypothetical protein BE20_41415 [Sorangium cellulosum]|uniref:Uncharacterized protein n=1 Tax=Sorangium cellulosum TaxID=56 RepID=A0A150R7J9_SORCE|nr:hypothetical protein BE18_26095 [Sorangium cellulosum]KYF96652.1 hypothetical protein BE20_41415 [Sorangium cellulosum]